MPLRCLPRSKRWLYRLAQPPGKAALLFWLNRPSWAPQPHRVRDFGVHLVPKVSPSMVTSPLLRWEMWGTSSFLESQIRLKVYSKLQIIKLEWLTRMQILTHSIPMGFPKI